MVRRLLAVKNLIFFELFIKMSLVIKMDTNDIKNQIDNENVNIEELSISELRHLKNRAKSLTDKRMKRKCKYKIWDIVCVALLAVISNCDEWEEIEMFGIKNKNWLRKFLLLTGGIPSAQTYERVISLLEPDEINKICVEFSNLLTESNRKKKEMYHFDGKVEKGSSRKDREIKPLNVLNVFSSKYGICIDQEMIEEKTNEITAIPKIIERLNLKGVVCTWDALNTQKESVKAVVEKGGDYVVALKGNQGNFYTDVQDYFDENKLLIISSGYEGSYSLTREKSHSRIITYEYYQTEKVNWYYEKDKWKKLRSIGMVRKTIEKNNGEKVTEKRYYISSLSRDIATFSKAIRGHWEVENKLHWQMDYTFKCDRNQTVNKKALYNLQIIKKFALNILNLVKEDYKRSLKKIRFLVGLGAEEEIHNIFYLLHKKKQIFK